MKRKTSPLTGAIVLLVIIAVYTGVFNRGDKSPPSVADKQANASSTATAQASAEKAAAQPKARAPKQRATKLPGYEVVLDDSSDTPIKTMVELRIMLDNRPSESELRALLRSLYEKAKERSGFKFRAHPNAVYIYAFGNRHYAKNWGASWIGMLSYVPDDKEPTISVDSSRLKAQFEEPSKHRGLTVEQRKQTTHRGLTVEQRKQKIYWELLEITDKAQRDADRKVPNPRTLEDFERQAGEWNKRHALYLKRLLLKYRITDKQRVQITLEGMQKNWPEPYPRRAEERRRAEAKRQELEARERRMTPLVVENWTWHIEHGFAIAEGEVTNRSDRRLENVEVVVSFYTKDNQFITSSDGFVEYNPILPGQTTPFKVYATHNPQMKSARLAFKHLLGGSIGYKNR